MLATVEQQSRNCSKVLVTCCGSCGADIPPSPFLLMSSFWLSTSPHLLPLVPGPALQPPPVSSPWFLWLPSSSCVFIHPSLCPTPLSTVGPHKEPKLLLLSSIFPRQTPMLVHKKEERETSSADFLSGLLLILSYTICL